MLLVGCGRLSFEPVDALRDDALDSHGQVGPLVRAGACILDLNQTSVVCPISPPLLDVADTALVFEATGDDVTPATADIRCRLAGTSAMSCDRWTTASAGESPVAISWQTVEHPSLHVQYLDFSCDSQLVFMQPVAPVNPAETFVLHSLMESGDFLNDDDFVTVELASPTSVTMTTGSSDPCGISGVGPMQGSIEVVEMTGASVTRGVAGPMAGLTLAVNGLPPVNPATTALMFSYRSASNNAAICGLVVRGQITSPTSLSFSRGLGNVAGCTGQDIEAVSWERIDFGALASVQPIDVTMPATVGSADAPITPVDVTRSIAFSSAQGVSGEGTGEGSYAAANLLGEIAATFALATDHVTLSRGTTFESAEFSGYVVQWN